ncbi:hypothetical protein [Aliihoeflea sp. 40Bstr573]|uniref:hypothetical protein n=1 Tax=Aliihoeflea sp. 40Bstr573 TaxID=2696467 RepID=UPI002094CC06|nr:hypothetical protein [Aliihoeflea sp. 40Bstr573]MCO6386234.1 hypothetical protein [Aliihoeflea sp. 40Bstr573]
MARVKFIRDFDWKPTRHTTIAYKADQEYTVRRECADAAVAAGAGNEVDAPRKGDDGSSQ